MSSTTQERRGQELVNEELRVRPMLYSWWLRQNVLLPDEHHLQTVPLHLSISRPAGRLNFPWDNIDTWVAVHSVRVLEWPLRRTQDETFVIVFRNCLANYFGTFLQTDQLQRLSPFVRVGDEQAWIPAFILKGTLPTRFLWPNASDSNPSPWAPREDVLGAARLIDLPPERDRVHRIDPPTPTIADAARALRQLAAAGLSAAEAGRALEAAMERPLVITPVPLPASSTDEFAHRPGLRVEPELPSLPVQNECKTPGQALPRAITIYDNQGLNQ